MKDKRDSILNDEVLKDVNGGVSVIYEETGLDTDNLKRVKCACGEIFMANLKAPTIICPSCKTDLKGKIAEEQEK
jgi:hypothetical protein